MAKAANAVSDGRSTERTAYGAAQLQTSHMTHVAVSRGNLTTKTLIIPKVTILLCHEAFNCFYHHDLFLKVGVHTGA